MRGGRFERKGWESMQADTALCQSLLPDELGSDMGATRQENALGLVPSELQIKEKLCLS